MPVFLRERPDWLGELFPPRSGKSGIPADLKLKILVTQCCDGYFRT
jgi:hypothetical protein